MFACTSFSGFRESAGRLSEKFGRPDFSELRVRANSTNPVGRTKHDATRPSPFHRKNLTIVGFESVPSLRVTFFVPRSSLGDNAAHRRRNHTLRNQRSTSS